MALLCALSPLEPGPYLLRKRPAKVRLPACVLPPRDWRTVLYALQRDLDAGSPLAAEVREIYAIPDTAGAHTATMAFCERHPEFQCGSGKRLIWAIACDSEVPVELFEEEPPSYRPQVRQQAARDRNTGKTVRLLDELRHLPRECLRTSEPNRRLAPDEANRVLPGATGDVFAYPLIRPLTAIANRLEMGTDELHDELTRLRSRRGLNVPKALDLEFRAWFEAGLACLEREALEEAQDDLIEIPVSALVARTGMTIEELEAHSGYPIVRRNVASAGEKRVMVAVPKRLLRGR